MAPVKQTRGISRSGIYRAVRNVRNLPIASVNKLLSALKEPGTNLNERVEDFNGQNTGNVNNINEVTTPLLSANSTHTAFDRMHDEEELIEDGIPNNCEYPASLPPCASPIHFIYTFEGEGTNAEEVSGDEGNEANSDNDVDAEQSENEDMLSEPEQLSESEDVYDGQLYKKIENYSQYPCNFSFMFYSDGVSLFKSSKYSVWPFFLIINELPYALRFLPQNIIFAGLWFGRNKPHFNTFLLPLKNSLTRLKKGVKILIKPLNKSITVKCILLHGIGDGPAKAIMMNFNQFNGDYGCPKCLLKGRICRFGEKGRVHIYPYERGTPLRTHADTIKHDDLINGFGIDLMHVLFSGSGKKNMEMWFDKHFKNKDFSLHNLMHIIDERLSKLRPPHFVTRLPRSLKTRELLKKYVRCYETLYGERHMSSNVHALLHLADCVEQTGPLWVCSCFPLEDLNGKMIRFVTLTRSAELQIHESFETLKKIPLFSESF
ncbi:hypothetical protein B566_EDAN013579, partial [Ephemera danica]